MQKVLLFSGGRTSGYMLRRMLDSIPDYRETWATVFCNTGREMSQTLDFVHEVETKWNVPVVWLEYSRTPARDICPGIFPSKRRNDNLARATDRGETAHWFKIVDYETASRNGEPFDCLLNWMTVLPNVISRGCSMQLKIRTAMRYLFSLGMKEYSSIIGIRADEALRATQILANCDAYEHPEFPLIRFGTAERDVLEFWKQNDFDLNLRSYEGNCDLCFLKAKWKRVLMARRNPEALKWWTGWERKKDEQGGVGRGKIFRRDEPYSMIAKFAAQQNADLPPAMRRQIETMERDGRIRETDEEAADIPCSCAEKAFAPDGDEV